MTAKELASVGVGATVIWDSAVGPVPCEYRGKSGDSACVIVREDGACPYQTMVPIAAIRKGE